MHILITGGSRGIGRATAMGAARRGDRVSFSYGRNGEAAAETLRAIEAEGAEGAEGHAERADAGSEAETIALFDAAEARFGPVDALVVNAGVIGPISPLAEMDADRIRRIVDVNVTGALLACREAARRMPTDRGGRGGSVVILSSAAARLGSPNEFVDYAASKGATDTLTLGLAREFAPGGVRVNGVRPGLIETEIHADAGRPDRATALAGNVPMGRAGSADEVAETVLWLTSEAASYVAGAIIDVTGGR